MKTPFKYNRKQSVRKKQRFNPDRSYIEKAMKSFKGNIVKVQVTNETDLVNNVDGQVSEFLREILYPSF